MAEKLIEGWDGIAALFNVSRRTAQRRREELQKAGAIFYKMQGKPPRKVVCAFPSVLKAWVSMKAARGEVF